MKMIKMKTPMTPNRLYRFIAIISVLAFVGYAAAQGNSWSGISSGFTHSYVAEPLNVTMGGARGLHSFSFVGAVGGVAFESVAQPDNVLKDKKITLGYDKSKTDGYRLLINIDKKSYHPFLPDWQLIPIAKYADSKYDACVSLFGKNTNGSNYHIVYHEAFENTLLGMRLLQTDIMLMEMNEFWKLPKYNGKILLGRGESLPDQNRWKVAASEINAIMQASKFQSWVYTDFGSKVIFSVEGDNFKITGYPYYYFWISNPDEYEKEFNNYKELAEKYLEKGDVLKHNEVVNKANKLEPKVYEVKEMTDAVKKMMKNVQELNPAVYNSSNQVMRFAAFFRYVKKNNTASWNNLLTSIQGIKVEPPVITPTQWNRPR